MRSLFRWSAPLVLILSALVAAPARAGFYDDDDSPLAEPQPFRVYQRDPNERATIAIRLDPKVKAKIRDVKIEGKPADSKLDTTSVEYADGALVGVPTGGPYEISVTLEAEGNALVVEVAPVFVGDLWLLAGQSNMQGVGKLIDVTPPHNRVTL